MNLFAANNGLLDLLVCLALLFILYRIPHWILGFVRLSGGGGRSLVGSLVKGFVMAKMFGALSHPDRPKRLSAEEKRRRTWRPPPDPAWPAKIHSWHGVDGQRGLAAMEQRMRVWRACEQIPRKPSWAVVQLYFREAVPQSPTHEAPASRASTVPAATVFRSPQRPQPTVAPALPSTPPPPARFRTANPSAPPLPPMRTAAVPPALRFVPPTPPPEPAQPAHATTAPAPVTFTHPETTPVHRRARTHTPTPAQFRAAEPPTATPAPRSAPAPTRFRAPTTRRSHEPSGDEK